MTNKKDLSKNCYNELDNPNARTTYHPLSTIDPNHTITRNYSIYMRPIILELGLEEIRILGSVTYNLLKNRSIS